MVQIAFEGSVPDEGTKGDDINPLFTQSLGNLGNGTRLVFNNKGNPHSKVGGPQTIQAKS